MGWLRLVGSLKLQVSFAKEPYKRDDILQKRPIILRSLLIVATPQHICQVTHVNTCPREHGHGRVTYVSESKSVDERGRYTGGASVRGNMDEPIYI